MNLVGGDRRRLAVWARRQCTDCLPLHRGLTDFNHDRMRQILGGPDCISATLSFPLTSLLFKILSA